MSVKIRLARHGRKRRPFYRIVVADSRSPRDGRFIEILGTYNPLLNPARVSVNQSKTFRWLGEGAELSETVRRIFHQSGVLSRYDAARSGDELQEEETKISTEIFGHELDQCGSKRKGKKKVVEGPAVAAAETAGVPEPEEASPEGAEGTGGGEAAPEESKE